VAALEVVGGFHVVTGDRGDAERPVPGFPRSAETEAARWDNRRLRALRTLVLEAIDSADEDSARMRRAVESVRRAWRAVPFDEATLVRLAHRIDNNARRRAKAATDEPQLQHVFAFVESMKAAQRRVEQSYLDRVNQTIRAAAAAAADQRADAFLSFGIFKEALTKVYNIARNAVAGLARDRVGTADRQTSEAHQTAGGAAEFIWTSQRDDRVRDLHRELDGQRFTWATGHPTEGLPGDPFGCRCFGVPV